jgi:2-succinyl-5-enolpyruvyl-6-hydroxy-3-cyclohexene-1-carboxylate synthase
VIIAGDCPPAHGRAVAALAETAGIPLLAEPSSNARRGRAALGTQRLLAGSSLAEGIERIVVFGHPTLSRPVGRLLARRDLELIMVTSGSEWIDPGLAASSVVDAVAFAEAGDPAWLGAWQAADAELRRQLDQLLSGQQEFSGPMLAARLWAALDERDILFVGSSNPIRDLDLARIAAAPATVYANRGLAGIDGSISTAVGIALAAEQPTHALLGDITAVHDATGLVIGPGEPSPDLRIVVANDDGGSIFATLEHGLPAHQRSFERIFGTPHRTQFATLAEATGAAHSRVVNSEELVEVLNQPPVGIELIEAVIDRSQRRSLDAAVTALAATL